MSPELAFVLGLMLKMVLTATIVVAASVAVERSGPFVGALIAALPTAAGAAYIILAAEHPASFVAQSAVGSMAANAVTGLFMLVYALLAQRYGLLVSVGSALAVWLAGSVLVRATAWTLGGAVLFSLAAYALTIPATRGLRAAAARSAPGKPRRYEIPLRALIVALFVVVVTTASHQIGSLASGVFAVFPIALTSFIVILHTRVSGEAASRTMAHAQVPMLGFGLSFAVLHLAAEIVGVWWAMLGDLAACVAWNAVLWWLRQRRPG